MLSIQQNMVIERIETATLNDLLARNGVEKIDFLSMDIEGYEPAALAGFDIVRYSPALVCIEASPENHEKLLSYFQKNEYAIIEGLSVLDDGLNWYFAPSGLL